MFEIVSTFKITMGSCANSHIKILSLICLPHYTQAYTPAYSPFIHGPPVGAAVYPDSHWRDNMSDVTDDVDKQCNKRFGIVAFVIISLAILIGLAAFLAIFLSRKSAGKFIQNPHFLISFTLIEV
jgi:hypothetical protein